MCGDPPRSIFLCFYPCGCFWIFYCQGLISYAGSPQLVLGLFLGPKGKSFLAFLEEKRRRILFRPISKNSFEEFVETSHVFEFLLQKHLI